MTLSYVIDRAVNRPSKSHYSVVEAKIWQVLGPCDLAQRVPRCSDWANRQSSVQVLRVPTGPSAIVWRIAGAWVNAVQRVTIGAWSHIAKEFGVVVAPVVAYGYAPATVEAVVAGRRRVAARLHAAPDSVFARLLSIVNAAVFDVAHCATRRLSTAATGRIATQQVFPVLDGCGSAVATADPMGATTFSLRSIALNDGELTESHPGKVFRCSQRHAHNYTAAALTVQAKVSA